jgi:hypothetical protein
MAIDKDTLFCFPFSAFRYTDISLRSISALNDRKCWTQSSIDETLENLKDAILMCLEYKLTISN